MLMKKLQFNIKLYRDFHAKLQVLLLLLLLLCMSCIKMYCRKYDVSFTSSKRVIYFHSTFYKEDQFPYKSSGSLCMRFTCSDVGISCIIYNVL